MGIPWASHGKSRGHPMEHSVGIPWASIPWAIVSIPWASRGHPTGIPWASHGHPVGIPSWASRGHPVDISCASRGHPMGIPRASDGTSSGHPMRHPADIPWASRGHLTQSDPSVDNGRFRLKLKSGFLHSRKRVFSTQLLLTKH